MKTNPILDTTMKGYEMTPALSVLELNAKHPPLDKKEVRQAIAYAIDRKVILRDVMYGYGQPATGPLTPCPCSPSKRQPPNSASLPAIRWVASCVAQKFPNSLDCPE